MQDKSLGRAADYRGDATRDCFCDRAAEGRDHAPQPSEVLYEIGFAIAGFLGVAVLAQLLVLALPTG